MIQYYISRSSIVNNQFYLFYYIDQYRKILSEKCKGIINNNYHLILFLQKALEELWESVYIDELEYNIETMKHEYIILTINKEDIQRLTTVLRLNYNEVNHKLRELLYSITCPKQ